MVFPGTRRDDDGYRSYFQAASDGMLLTDEGRSVLDANPSGCRLLGRSREELVGTLLDDLFDPSYPVLEAAWERQRDSGSFYVSALLLRGDGSSFPSGVSVSGGGAGGLVVVFQDAGRQEGPEAQQLEQETQAPPARASEYRAMVEGAMDAMLVCNLDNTFRYVNPALGRFLGYEPEELVGRFVPDIIHPEDMARAAEANARIHNSIGSRGPYEIRYRHKNGSWVYLETTLNNLANDPEVRGVVAICRDVTERAEAEQRLKESEERFRALVENAQDFVVLADENNVALYASPSLERIMGYTPEEFVGTVIAGYVHPDDLESTLESVAQTMGILGPHTMPLHRYRRKDGSDVYLEVVVNNRLDDPVLRGVVCNCRDVTERVEAERALRESEERHRALNENALDLVAVLKADNTIGYASPSFEPLLGHKPADLLGTLAADYIHPEDLEWAWPLFYESIQDPEVRRTVVIRYRHKDGSWRWFESAFSNQFDNPAVGGLVFNCRDVTERVEAEERLREAEERYRMLVERVPAATYIARGDTESSTVYVSPQIEALLGYTPEEWTSDQGLWLRTLHPEDHGRVLARHLRCNETGEPFDEEYRCFAKDGREVWVRDEAVLVRGGEGESLYWQGVKADITGRKRAELEILRLNTELRGQVSGYTAELKAAIEGLKESESYLKEREEQFHATFERAAVGISHVSPKGRFLRVNGKLCEILGYGREELANKSFQEITHPDDLDADLEQVEGLLSGKIREYSLEKRYFRKDGSTVWANLSVSLVRRDAGVPGHFFIAVIEDITRRKGAEAVLKALSPREVEILGRLAKGHTNAEIAAEMSFSPNTVKAHVASVIDKLGVSDRTEAAAHAVEMGLFTPRFKIPESPPATPRSAAAGEDRREASG